MFCRLYTSRKIKPPLWRRGLLNSILSPIFPGNNRTFLKGKAKKGMKTVIKPKPSYLALAFRIFVLGSFVLCVVFTLYRKYDVMFIQPTDSDSRPFSGDFIMTTVVDERKNSTRFADVKNNRTKTILLYNPKHWEMLMRGTLHDLWEGCPYRCELTRDRSKYDVSDAVLFVIDLLGAVRSMPKKRNGQVCFIL